MSHLVQTCTSEMPGCFFLWTKIKWSPKLKLSYFNKSEIVPAFFKEKNLNIFKIETLKILNGTQ